jgi:hypothetical protein
MRASDEGEGRRCLDGLRERERRRLDGLRERMSENETLAALYIPSAISGRLWASGLRGWASIYRGGPYNVTVSVNVFIEVVALEQPPRLIDINRCGHF